MSVTEVLDGLGSWSLTLRPDTPGHVYDRLAHFGHVAILTGQPNVELTGDGLLGAARYVGVMRKRSRDDRRVIEGSGMALWLGDEDGKGAVFENPVSLVNATLAQAVAAVLPSSVQLGTIFPGATGTYTGRHQFETPRSALTTIVQSFGREFRVNGNGTVDVGTQAQLYRSNPNAIAVSKSAGSDFDLTTLGTKFATEDSTIDYTTRVLLLGQTTDSGTIATGSADAAVVPYRDLFGNVVRRTRMISESGQTEGSVGARAQLQLNRFARVGRALKVSGEGYERSGNFRVGDLVYVFDPDAGLFNVANEVYFNGQTLNPDTIRVTGMSWQITRLHTIAFRTTDGEWIDLTPYVEFETGAEDIKVGDLPRTLGSGGNPVQDRVDAAPDMTVPNAPTGVTLSSQSFLTPNGSLGSYLTPSWTAPATNTDGSVFADLAYYSIRYRATGRPTWEYMQSAQTSFDIRVTPGVSYEVGVAAVDKAGNVGAYSGTVTGVSSVDTFAPPAPADPIVSSFIGQLRMEYSGKAADGSNMPSDTNRVDVHVGDTANFTADVTNRVSSLNPFARGVALTSSPYGVTRYVRLLAIDNAGNVSSSSAVISGVAVQANDNDIAALNVGKLVAGTMTAEVVNAGRIATALTGARVEMNGSGFYKYGPNNEQLVAIDGTRALLTGVYQSASSGRRIEIGQSAAQGQMKFIANDERTFIIRTITETTGNEAAIFQWLNTDGSSDNSVSLTVRPMEKVWAVRGYGSQQIVRDSFSVFVSDSGTNDLSDVTQRFGIGREESIFRFGAGRGTVSINRQNSGQEVSPLLRLIPNNGVAVALRGSASSSAQYLDVVNFDGSGWYSVRASQFLAQSDEAVKTNIESVSTADMLTDVLAMKVKRYHRQQVGEDGRVVVNPREEIGFIAQQVAPRVSYSGDGTSFVDTYQTLALTVGALQENNRLISELRKDVDSMKGKFLTLGIRL